MKKRLITFLCAMMVLTGCRTNGRQIDATYNIETYKDYMTPDNRVDNLNYLITNDEKDLSLLGNLVDGLVETDKYGNLKPALAQDLGVASSSYTVWDFSIRDEIPWVDVLGEKTGEYVTADDFVCGIQYVLDHKNESAYYSEVVSLIKNAQEYAQGNVKFGDVGVKAINTYTVRFTLKESCSYFNTYLLNGGFYPVNRKLLKDMGDDFATSPAMMWYNGAYHLETFTEEKITFKKNSHYWEVGQVSFESGSFVLVDDNQEALSLFKDGDLSYAYIDASYAESNSKSIDSHMYMSASSPEVYAFLFNYNSKNDILITAFASENFRKALLYGMNTHAGYVVQSVDSEETNTQNTSAQSTFVPSEFITTSEGIDYLSLGSLGNISSAANYNQGKYQDYASKAMTELQEKQITFPIEIGVPLELNDEIALNEFNRMVSGFDSTFVTFKIMNYTNDKDNKEYPSFSRLISNNEYGMVLTSFAADHGDPTTYLSNFLSTDSFNAKYMSFKDELYDSLYTAANQIQSADARLMALAECESYLINKAVAIPFSHGNLSYKVSSINDYSYPRGTYGLARFKLKGIKATEAAITIKEREEMKSAYEQAKNSGL